MIALVEPGFLRRRSVAAPPPLRFLVEAAARGAPLDAEMRRLVGEFGFANFTYGRFAGPRPKPAAGPLLWTTDSRDWIKLYDRKAYAKIDPRLTQTERRASPLLWDSARLRRHGRLGGFLSDAAQFGIRSGVAVSFRARDLSRVVVSFDSPVSPVGPERREHIARRLGDIMLVATGFHDVFMPPALPDAVGEPDDAPLTPRELECLRMAAHGLSSAEIAIKLGVAPRTIDFHIRNVIGKLRALNRREAAARAIAAGLIGIEV
jgi:DNA-binding CsgD family transcriptional regulator